MRNYLSRALASAQSKHTTQTSTSEISQRLRKLALLVQYPYSDVGIGKGRSWKEDRQYTIDISQEQRFRPIKFVVTRDGRLWADNTHWALAALIRFGLKCTVADVPYYFVDIRKIPPNLSSPPVGMGEAGIQRAIRLALNIQNRIDLGWRPANVSYTIGELFTDGDYSTISSAR